MWNIIFILCDSYTQHKCKHVLVCCSNIFDYRNTVFEINELFSFQYLRSGVRTLSADFAPIKCSLWFNNNFLRYDNMHIVLAEWSASVLLLYHMDKCILMLKSTNRTNTRLSLIFDTSKFPFDYFYFLARNKCLYEASFLVVNCVTILMMNK